MSFKHNARWAKSYLLLCTHIISVLLSAELQCYMSWNLRDGVYVELWLILIYCNIIKGRKHAFQCILSWKIYQVLSDGLWQWLNVNRVLIPNKAEQNVACFPIMLIKYIVNCCQFRLNQVNVYVFRRMREWDFTWPQRCCHARLVLHLKWISVDCKMHIDLGTRFLAR